MHAASRSSFALCTSLALFRPAFAHDGAHHFTYLQSLLHELAYGDALPFALAAVAAGSAVAWRLLRRKPARTRL